MESAKLFNVSKEYIYHGHDIIERIGDCSNYEYKVKVNSFLWESLFQYKGLILQRNRLYNIARIVDDNSVQKANGSLLAMCEKMGRMLSNGFLTAGDMIGVSRGAYEHYAIYVGDNRVIHYAADGSDSNGEISIHEAPFEEFIKNSTSYFVISFEGKYPVKIHSSTRFISSGYYDYANIKFEKKYSNQETINRAYSRIGESKYSLIRNNCEHFALWCKTGNAESLQVRRVAKQLMETGVVVNRIMT